VTPQAAFDQYSQAVYDFLFRMTRRADLAEDLTQETFLNIVRTPERFDPSRGSAKAYLFAIARNLALKHYRDRGQEKQMGDLELQTWSTDPRELLDAGAAVAAAVSSLPPLQQETLILFEYEGATLQEIAQIAGADVGTVKSRLHRARGRLKRLLASPRFGGGVRGIV
jgi:RNA polymerase sigma-70 factor (ECF subfamily)